jgi:hypothetical protein
VVVGHNLEGYLHGMAGQRGRVQHGGRPLVNKGADALKDKYPVPSELVGRQE